MPSVTSFTAARSQAIEDEAIVSGGVVGNDLILTKNNGNTVNAGNVRGGQGIQGIPGEVTNVAMTAALNSLKDELPWGLIGYAVSTVRDDSPTTLAALTDLSITIVVPIGRRIEIKGLVVSEFQGNAPLATDFGASLYVYDGNTDLGKVAQHWQRDEASPERNFETLTGSLIDTPTSGSHTYSLRSGSNHSSQHRIRGDSTPSRLFVYDVGPAV